jgi:hypothetical protein
VLKLRVLGSALLIPALLAGCSDNGSSRSSSLISVYVQAGQEDFSDALIRYVAVTEAGTLAENSDKQLVSTTYTSNNEAEATVAILAEELSYFDIIGRVADTDADVPATTRKCQVSAGCTYASTTVAFGETYHPVATPGWRSVAYSLANKERVRVTALTDLAAQLAFAKVYSEASSDTQDGGWLATGYYSAYSVEQSVSQISRLFGITNIQTAEPADLTQLNDWHKANPADAINSIRYGALLAAWQSLELSYTPTSDLPTYASAVGADLVTNDGQLFEKGGTQTLNLNDFYTLASDNLAAIDVSNETVQGFVDSVISGFEADQSGFTADALTAVTPDTLANLFGTNYSDFTIGLQRTKAFVNVLRDYQETFFEAGYRAEVDAYADQLKAIGDAHADDLDAIVLAFRQTQELYIDCYLNGACPSLDASWTWLTDASYDAATSSLTLNGGAITVSYRVADVNPTDADTTPTSSNAIDILIRGTYNEGDLRFIVDNTYVNNDPNNDIVSSSGVRIYYTTAASAPSDSIANPILGYEIRWSDFSLYDVAAISTDAENEVTGSFRLFYRGVADPEGLGNMHFNIDTVVLNGRISDVVVDEGNNDQNITTVFISASSANSDSYYGETEFAAFNGFFSPTASSTYVKGQIETAVASYKLGNETLNGNDVEYLDYYVPSADSYRYRFYPTVYRADTSDIDRDGNIEELIPTHYLEQCLLENTGSTWSIVSCEPRQRLNAKRDVQQAINDLWEVGVFARLDIPGRGAYFIEWPVNAPDENGCLTLAPLSTDEVSFDGELYDPEVLGLTTARFTSEVFLEYDGLTSTTEPRTLLDVLISAPALDSLNVTAALSHDYSSLSLSDVYLGAGTQLDRLLVNYNTESAFGENGSIAVYKDGVSLTLDDGTTSSLDSELTAYANLDYPLGFEPYRYILDDEGNYDRCVTSNVAEYGETRNLDDTIFYLNFRDVVYGRIAKENGIWIIRYIDGSWESLL